MVRNIVVLGGSSHPQLNETICNHLGIPPPNILLSKFSVGETRVEIKESVRGKDVYIIQSGGGKVNDHLMELLITISACKTASAKQVTAVLPLFPYSRQSDIPYNKTGAPLARASANLAGYSFESRPQTPHPGQPQSAGLNGSADNLHNKLSKAHLEQQHQGPSNQYSPNQERIPNGVRRSDTLDSNKSESGYTGRDRGASSSSLNQLNGQDDNGSTTSGSYKTAFQPQPGYKQWVAQAGTLVADLLTCAGADHIITMDLHDPQYQGFFDIPVDNLYGRPLLKRYIQFQIPDYQQAIIVSPDAGGAKRATAIADNLGMDFALIHKVSPTPPTPNARLSTKLIFLSLLRNVDQPE